MPWPSIDPGQLRHKLTFLSPVTSAGVAGTEVTYQPGTPPVTARAKMQVMNATDVIKSGQDIAQVIAIFTIRYQAGIAPDMRFTTERGSTWIIRAVNNVEDRNRILELTCLGLGSNN